LFAALALLILSAQALADEIVFDDDLGTDWWYSTWACSGGVIGYEVHDTVVASGSAALRIDYPCSWGAMGFEHRLEGWSELFRMTAAEYVITFDINFGSNPDALHGLLIALESDIGYIHVNEYLGHAEPSTWYHVEIPLEELPGSNDDFFRMLFIKTEPGDAVFFLDNIVLREAAGSLTSAVPRCDDALDNDGDGLFDLHDPGCEDPADDDEHNPPELAPEMEWAYVDGLTDEWAMGLWQCSNDGIQYTMDGDLDVSYGCQWGAVGFEHREPGWILHYMHPDDYDALQFRISFEDDTAILEQLRIILANGMDSVYVKDYIPSPQPGTWYNVWIPFADFAGEPNEFFRILFRNAGTATGRFRINDFVLVGHPPAPVLPQCGDGVDNDGDGLFDLEDPGCAGAADDDEYDPPAPASQCSDALDNDADGAVDLEDPGCEGPTDDDEGSDTDLPAPIAQCADGLDNDQDGSVDLLDPGCTDADDDDERDPVVVPADAEAVFVDSLTDGWQINTWPCSDGTIAYQVTSQISVQYHCQWAGFGLEHRAADWTEIGYFYPGQYDAIGFSINLQQPEAASGISVTLNNSDGSVTLGDYLDTTLPGTWQHVVIPLEDFPGDADRFFRVYFHKRAAEDVDFLLDNVYLVPGTQTVFVCSDGLDNDSDGVADMEDPGCSSVFDHDEYNVPILQCNDGADNDGDGLSDLDDPGCENESDDDETNLSACEDGLDNDDDGLIDLNDPGCGSPGDNEEYNRPAPACSDGDDNDGDGLVDLDDPDCREANDGTERPVGSGWLYTQGNKIYTPDGDVWVGKGANIHDTRSCNRCAYQQPNPDEVKRRIDELVDIWGADFLRLALEAYPSADGRVHYANVLEDPGYLADIVEIVEHVATKDGVYVEISLWVDPTLTDYGWPSEQTVDVWRVLAETFAEHPNVIFGVVNEPEWNYDGALDSQVWEAMTMVVNAIRKVEDSLGVPHHLIAVQGTGGWARFLDYYVDNPIQSDNIAYEVHVYDPASEFTDRFIDPAQHIPVIIGELGPASGYMTLEDTQQLMDLAEQHGVPYLGWTFHERCPPNLLQLLPSDSCGVNMPLVPTEWGRQLLDRLRGG
jgi:endoglucanase